MINFPNPIRNLSDDHLLRHVQQLAADERALTVQLIAALAELDGRRLYLAAGCSSLFTYCTQVLRLSEHAAYGRIEAARTARRYPVVLELLAEGEITLTTITLLAAHLTPDNHQQLLESSRNKSRRDVERLVAVLQPRPVVPWSIHPLPAAFVGPLAASRTATGHSSAADASADASEPSSSDASEPSSNNEAPLLHGNDSPSVRSAMAPIAPQRYRIQLTISAETHDKLRRAQDLMRHVQPDGDPAAILDRALTILLEQLERRKLAAAAKPRANTPVADATPSTRYIPAPIRRAVWARDDGRCAFVGTEGRCTERGFLEFHHVKAYAEGGETSVDNLQLRCRAHNQYEAQQLYGPWTNSVRTELPPGRARPK
jgi:hypothetical protein